jgi:hypothetical protein
MEGEADATVISEGAATVLYAAPVLRGPSRAPFARHLVVVLQQGRSPEGYWMNDADSGEARMWGVFKTTDDPVPPKFRDSQTTSCPVRCLEERKPAVAELVAKARECVNACGL